MRKLLVLYVLFFMIALSYSAHAQATVQTFNEQTDVDYILLPQDYPCLPEAIHVQGSYQNRITNSLTPSSVSRVTWDQNLMKITAIGLETGTNYQYNGPYHATMVQTNGSEPILELTVTNHNHWTGHGVNLYQQLRWHFVYDETSARVDFYIEDGFCK